MHHLHFSSRHASPALFRQTPGNDGRWQDMVVTLEDPEQQARWLVVYDRHREPLLTRVPRERRILMVSEPPEFQAYDASYLAQFGSLLSPYPIPAFKGRQIITQTALPWFYGMNVGGGGDNAVAKFWSELEAPTLQGSERRFEITAICSTKTQTKNQVRRLRFLRLLKAELGDRLTIFGRGFEPLDDKAGVIEQSRYHLALENNLQPNGWTEKTADAILGGAFPLHGGSSAITADFDSDGLVWLDLTRPRMAVAAVLDCLERNPAASPQGVAAMARNKNRLMQEHNLFSLLQRQIGALANECGQAPQCASATEIVWYKGAAKGLRLPRPLRRLVWQMQIALFERD